MKLSRRYTFANAGELLSRNKKIKLILESLEAELEEVTVEESAFLLGEISAIRDNWAHPHKKIVENCVDVKKEIKETEEFFEENKFLEGYLKGVEVVLSVDRQVFKEPIEFVFFVYSEDEDILDKYRLVFSTIDEFAEFNGWGVRYYISGNSSDICGKIQDLCNDTEYVVYVVYNKDSLPQKETMQQLCFGEFSNVYLHKDQNEENVEQIIVRLLKSITI